MASFFLFALFLVQAKVSCALIDTEPQVNLGLTKKNTHSRIDIFIGKQEFYN